MSDDLSHDLSSVAPAFVEMAHRIVWCSAATVDRAGRPRSRVLHPVWEWDGTDLRGWIATSPLSPKHDDLEVTPFISLNYWASNHDTCLAECAATWTLDDESRVAGWDRIKNAPRPSVTTRASSPRGTRRLLPRSAFSRWCRRACA